MPNTGRPSRGCKECKARKVKCDEALPTCRRCLRNGRDCSGVLSTSDVAFRNNTSGPATKELVKTAPPNSASSSWQLSVPTAIPTPMSIDLHGQAISMYFHDYVIKRQESQIDTGYLDVIPGMVAKASEASSLSHAVSAVALASFAHRLRLGYLLPQARRAYGKALQSTISTIGKYPDPSDPHISGDFMLATIIMLSSYEIISGEKPREGLWSCHTNILESLLCARNGKSDQSQDSKSLTVVAHGFTMMKKLSEREHFDEHAALPSNDDQELLINELQSINRAVCNTINEIHDILQQSSFDLKSLEFIKSLIGSSTMLHERLRTWETQASRVHPYHHVESARLWPPGSPSATGAPTSIHVYSSVSIANVWNIHRTSRIYLLRGLIRSLTRQALEQGQILDSVGNADIEAQLKDETQRLASDVCSTVPFMLGEIDQEDHLLHNQHNKAIGGMFLLWPLGSLLPLGYLPPERITWIRERLNYIRDGLGIQHWVNSVPTGMTKQ